MTWDEAVFRHIETEGLCHHKLKIVPLTFFPGKGRWSLERHHNDVSSLRFFKNVSRILHSDFRVLTDVNVDSVAPPRPLYYRHCRGYGMHSILGFLQLLETPVSEHLLARGQYPRYVCRISVDCSVDAFEFSVGLLHPPFTLFLPCAFLA